MDATDRHGDPREAAATLRAHWAWFRDDTVPACSAGPGRRAYFERLVRPALDERAEPGWIGVTTSGREDPFVAMAFRDLDGVRYFTAPYAEIAAGGASYSALWQAFRRIELPTDRERPLRIRLPASPATPTRRRDGDFAWFAGVAAAVLAGPVLITGADRLDTRDRLELLDRVAALLPYGARAGLRFSTSAGPVGRGRPRLGFGDRALAGAVAVALDAAPAAPGTDAARAYLDALDEAHRRAGVHALTAALAALRAPGSPTADPRVLDRLAEIAAPHGHARRPDTRPGAAVPDAAGHDERGGVLARLLAGEAALADPVPRRWRAEDGDELTRDMAAALRAHPAGLAIGWNTAVGAERADRLVHVLLGPVPPILPAPTPQPRYRAGDIATPADRPRHNGSRTAPDDDRVERPKSVSPEALVADLCRLLGPGPTTDVPALYDALWNHPVVLRRLLDTAGHDLRAWLDVIRPWDDRAPEWLAPYALLAGERLRAGEIPPAEAVFALRVAGRTDVATASGVLHDLWPVLVPLAERREDPAAQGLGALLAAPLGPNAPAAARVRADTLRLGLGIAPCDGPYSAAELLALRSQPLAQGRLAPWIGALARALPLPPAVLSDLVAAGDPDVTAALADAVLADPALGDRPGLDNAWWAALARTRPALAARAAAGWFRDALRGVDAAGAAAVWAGEIVEGPARARRDLYTREAGRWWHGASGAQRALLLPGLERELTTRGCTPVDAREEVRAIRLLIAGHMWGPEAAIDMVAHEQEEFDAFRRHLKHLRAALKNGDGLRGIALPVVLVLAVLFAGLPTGGARAAGAAPARTVVAEPADPFGAERLLADLDADRESVDYVILVDASESMRATGRYAAVRGALADFLDTLTARDRVALISFDTSATEYGNGLEPVTDPAAMVARLPATPPGTPPADPVAPDPPAPAAPSPTQPPDPTPAEPVPGTPVSGVDAALSRALTVLRTTAPDAVTGVVLLSDAAPAAIGADLRADFDRLSEEGRAIEGYAIPLASDSTAGPALTRVLPRARTLRDNPADPGVGLAQARTGLRLVNAARIIDTDKDKGVEATWMMPPEEEPDAIDCRVFKPVPADRRLDLSEGGELCLRLIANTARVPLQVTRLRVDGVGVVGLEDGAPLLAPGRPVYFSVNVAARTHRTDGMWKDAGHYESKAHVVGEVRTPLAESIREHLPDTTLALRPEVRGDDLLYRGDERVDLSWWPWLLVGLGTLAFAGATWFGWAWVRPRLRRRRTS